MSSTTTELGGRAATADLAIDRSFIGGALVAGGGAEFCVWDPATGAPAATVRANDAAQISDAIRSARATFDSGSWSQAPRADRIDAVVSLLDELDAARGQLIDVVIAETGCPRTMTELAQVGLALSSARELVELFSRTDDWEHNELPLEQHVAGRTLRLSVRAYEAAGVAALISPNNFPFITNVWKAVPAMLAGCTVVLRPSPDTPLDALLMGAAASRSRLPAGVFHVVVEDGATGAGMLSSHPSVDVVSFTGSARVGRLIAAQAAPTLKRVILELGGKSIGLYLADVLDEGLEPVVTAACGVFSAHAGQGCALQTRILVPAAQRDDVADAVAAAAAQQRIGDPRDASTVVGPLISEAQRDRVDGIIRAAMSAGARLVCGGRQPVGRDAGWYYEPTVLVVDDNDNPAVRDEIFGPVVTVQGYAGVDEAVEMANDNDYGLSGAVYTNDLALGLSIAQRIRTGTVQVNAGHSSGYTAMGGYKQSGYGRERGLLGLRAFQESKHIVVGSRSST